MPRHRPLPKRGFTNIFKPQFVVVNLGRIQAALDSGRLPAGAPVNAESLQAAGLVNRLRDGVRLLAKGEITAKIEIEVVGASAAAIAAVEKAGGHGTVTAPQAAAAE